MSNIITKEEDEIKCKIGPQGQGDDDPRTLEDFSRIMKQLRDGDFRWIRKRVKSNRFSPPAKPGIR